MWLSSDISIQIRCPVSFVYIYESWYMIGWTNVNTLTRPCFDRFLNDPSPTPICPFTTVPVIVEVDLWASTHVDTYAANHHRKYHIEHQTIEKTTVHFANPIDDCVALATGTGANDGFLVFSVFIWRLYLLVRREECGGTSRRGRCLSQLVFLGECALIALRKLLAHFYCITLSNFKIFA